MTLPLHIIVLAAGDGTRMRSTLPKVLHPVCGAPMLAHVLETARALEPERIHVVYNPEHEELPRRLASDGVDWVPQAERLGTGHAVQQAMPRVPEEATVLVLYGDTPLVPAELLLKLVDLPGEAPALITMDLPRPTGYGRILRDDAGAVTGIVEERDATEEQRRIQEVNSGICRAPGGALRGWLRRLQADNAQGEYYLTDVVGIARAEGVTVGSVRAPDPSLLAGVNDRAQLAELEDRCRRLRAESLMKAGVSIADPRRIDLRGRVRAAPDVRLEVNVVLEGENRLGEGTEVGVGCVLRDCRLAAGTRVHPYSVLEGVETTGPCDIGPFARLRPGTRLAAGTRVGNFVETKNASFGEGSKASHLSYVGDAEVGREVNIGAGTITCNYDGANKHRTVIGDGAFIGSDSQLVAPVTVGAGATIGAGSTINKDAPPGELTVSRARQTTVRGWKRPRKTPSEGKGD